MEFVRLYVTEFSVLRESVSIPVLCARCAFHPLIICCIMFEKDATGQDTNQHEHGATGHYRMLQGRTQTNTNMALQGTTELLKLLMIIASH